MTKTSLHSGWAHYPKIPGRLSTYRNGCEPKKVEHIPRAMGRSYGDQAIRENGLLLNTLRNDKVLSFDLEKGLIKAEAGLTLDALITICLPHGFFPFVVPGTKYISLGGAIANDVHGKGHHKDGSFLNHCTGFSLRTLSGEKLWCSPEENSALFYANAGGCGLLGMIEEVELELRPIASPLLETETYRASCIEGQLDLLDGPGLEADFSVSWINSSASGKKLGAGLLNCGRHSPLPANFAQHPQPKISIPPLVPNKLINKYSMELINFMLGRIQASKKGLIHYNDFFFPLDAYANWWRAYGREGFIQYQFSVPLDSGRKALREALQYLRDENIPISLNVLKRFGEGNPFLSFPSPGYTLALDFPLSQKLFPALHELSRFVNYYGGRVYLAKDAMLRREDFEPMYPMLKQWKSIRTELDPQGLLKSNLSARLNL